MKKVVLVVGIAAVVIIIAGVALWNYHEQPQFCATCHVMQPYLESWESSAFLAQAHAEENVTCLDCHEPTIQQQMEEGIKFVTKDYEDPLKEREFDQEWCLRCHEHGSYEELIQRTEELERNPHDSHYGEMECSICHKVHRASEDYCAQCHDPVATGPQWATSVQPTTTTPATATPTTTTPPTTSTPPTATTATTTPPTTEVVEWDPDMDCGAVCHVMQPYVDSLQDANLSAYTHAQEELVCLDCHELAVLEEVHEGADPGATELKGRKFSDEFCFDCHLPNEHTSYPEIIERTKDYTVDDEEVNPHDPHAGVEGTDQEQFECYRCHKMHKESRGIGYCYGCHHAGVLVSCSECH